MSDNNQSYAEITIPKDSTFYPMSITTRLGRVIPFPAASMAGGLEAGKTYRVYEDGRIEGADVGLCAVCGRRAPLVYDECPNCRH